VVSACMQRSLEELTASPGAHPSPRPRACPRRRPYAARAPRTCGEAAAL
jgi:hypothetical protein